MSDLPVYTMYRGRTRTFTQTVDKAGLGNSGVAGMTFTFMAKRKVTDADVDAVIVKHNADFTVAVAGNSTTDAQLTFTLTPTDTASFLAYTVLQIEVSVLDLAGKQSTLSRGVLVVDNIVVRAIS